MKVLVVNCGSSTLKFEIIELLGLTGLSSDTARLARGVVDRIGAAASLRFQLAGGAEKRESASVVDHGEAVVRVIDWLRAQQGATKFDAVGHRVVHGGERFTESVLIDDSV